MRMKAGVKMPEKGTPLFPKSATCVSCYTFNTVCCGLVGKNGYSNPKCKGCCNHKPAE